MANGIVLQPRHERRIAAIIEAHCGFMVGVVVTPEQQQQQWRQASEAVARYLRRIKCST